MTEVANFNMQTVFKGSIITCHKGHVLYTADYDGLVKSGHAPMHLTPLGPDVPAHDRSFPPEPCPECGDEWWVGGFDIVEF